MEFIEVSGKTIEDAITEASVQLGAASSEIVYEIVQEGSTGFLGLGSKPAIIKAKKKGTCYVYTYAQNGVYKKIKIIVK